MSKAADTMYQVSTLQALSLGYTRPVTTVGELLEHGDTGLGTFEDVNGEGRLSELGIPTMLAVRAHLR